MVTESGGSGDSITKSAEMWASTGLLMGSMTQSLWEHGLEAGGLHGSESVIEKRVGSQSSDHRCWKRHGSGDGAFVRR